MAEQIGHDVVNQTRSGGDASPSDGPVSKPDNYTAKGDGEGLQSKTNEQSQTQQAMSLAKPDGAGMDTTYDEGERVVIGNITVSLLVSFFIFLMQLTNIPRTCLRQVYLHRTIRRRAKG